MLRVPAYYLSFRCTAEQCQDNCCIGWEIDLDDQSYNEYLQVQGEFGRQLRAGIAKGDPPYFQLVNNRCVFLNGQNLCEIYRHLGQESLCQICRDHPRYFEWMGSITEAGIGLCCEEGCRQLFAEEQVNLIELADEGSDEGWSEEDCLVRDFLFQARAVIFQLLEKEEELKNLPSKLFSFADTIQQALDEGIDFIQALDVEAISMGTDPFIGNKWAVFFRDIVPIFQKLEFMETIFPEKLARIVSNQDALQGYLTDKVWNHQERQRYKRLLWYFIHRYWMKGLIDDRVLDKMGFAFIAVAIIILLDALDELEGKGWSIENAKYFGKEIESSIENIAFFMRVE